MSTDRREGTDVAPVPSAPGLWARVTTNEVVGAAMVAVAAASALSGSDVVSALLIAGAIAISLPAIMSAMPRNRFVQLATVTGALWVLYGLLVGSMPGLTDLGALRAWISSEGRSIVGFVVLAAASTIDDRAVFEQMCRRISLVVSGTFAVGLALFAISWSPLGFQVRKGDLFQGLASSHHVVGFTAAAVILIVVAKPTLLAPIMRWAVLGISLLSLALCGSRSGFIGLAAGVLVVIVTMLGRRAAVMTLAALVVVGVLLTAAVPRLRQTVDIMTRAEFLSEVSEAYSVGTVQRARELSDSGVEANILIRFSLWGSVSDTIGSSPFVGIGIYRLNDIPSATTSLGPFGELVTGGERIHSDAQPHNMYLYLLAETGLLGLALFLSPYVLAAARLRRRVRGATDDPDRNDVALMRGSLTMGLVVGCFSAGLLTAGLGFIVNIVVFGGIGGLHREIATEATEVDDREQVS